MPKQDAGSHNADKRKRDSGRRKRPESGRNKSSDRGPGSSKPKGRTHNRSRSPDRTDNGKHRRHELMRRRHDDTRGRAAADVPKRSRSNHSRNNPRTAATIDVITDDPVQCKSFFCGLLPREDVEMILEEQGEFTVRRIGQQHTSNCFKQLCVSVRWNDSVHHILMRRSHRGLCTLEGEEFETVDLLVEHYHKTKEVLTENSGARLLIPLRKFDWLLRDAQLDPIQSLGEGNFGEVWKARFRKRKDEPVLGVAVKFLKQSGVPEQERRIFFSECRKLRQLEHRHLVAFVGIIVDTEPIKLVMELCDEGMVSVLKRSPVSWVRKTQFCLHISRGMEYLTACQVIHRDLAARNCLIKNKIIKIADLGMAQVGLSYKMEDVSKPIPIKWTCPNTIKTKVYNQASDVWSFGIVMWEIANDGKPPYFDLQSKYAGNFAEKLIIFLHDGNRPKIPDDSPRSLPQLMNDCLRWNPQERPNFQGIRERLEGMYSEMGGVTSFKKSYKRVKLCRDVR